MAKWSGSTPSCDLCESVDLDGVFYDARIPMTTPVPFAGVWAKLCTRCFDLHNCKLGTGHGQKYELQSDGTWLKVLG